MKIRTLIIEDDIKISKIHQYYVEKNPAYEVIGIANSLADGLEMAKTLEPDLILLDVFFPEGSGIDLLYTIRGEQPMIDVILITAAKEAVTLKSALRGGAFDYIVKPVVFDRFNETLESYITYKKKLDTLDTLEQDQIDSLMNIRTHQQEEAAPTDLPKGIDPLTLKKVRAIFLQNDADGLSAERVGTMLGINRTTARRYLEFLVSEGVITADQIYGSVGRPERLYFRVMK